MQPNQWLLHSSRIVIAILGCVEIATTGKKTGATGTYHPSTARAREAGEYLLYYLLNQFGQFPPPTGPTSLSAPVKEPDMLTADSLSSRNVQCFLFDRTLITVVSYPRTTSVELGLLLRDQVPYKCSRCPPFFMLLTRAVNDVLFQVCNVLLVKSI